MYLYDIIIIIHSFNLVSKYEKVRKNNSDNNQSSNNFKYNKILRSQT